MVVEKGDDVGVRLTDDGEIHVEKTMEAVQRNVAPQRSIPPQLSGGAEWMGNTVFFCQKFDSVDNSWGKKTTQTRYQF
jgi:hypothetical protein